MYVPTQIIECVSSDFLIIFIANLPYYVCIYMGFNFHGEFIKRHLMVQFQNGKLSSFLSKSGNLKEQVLDLMNSFIQIIYKKKMKRKKHKQVTFKTSLGNYYKWKIRLVKGNK